MKVFYIIAWIGLALSVIVHVLSILGPEDVLSDIDGIVWMLHGGAILLGFPAVLCSQKLISGTQEKDFWKAVLKDCPLWMSRMVGFFFLYGIISFIIFMTTSEGPTHGRGTPAHIFKGFSGHWMIFYSIEVAIFHSYLKKKLSDVSNTFFGDKIVPMDKESRHQYDSITEYKRIRWDKYFRIIVIFFIVGGIFLILLWLAFRGYPWFLGCTLFSLFPFAVVNMVYAAYSGWKHNVYIKKNHFEIWKKGKSSFFVDRVEAQRLIKELDDPYLKSLSLNATKFSKICFWVWMIVIGVIIIGLILLQ